MTAIVLGQTPIALALVILLPMPSREAWPFILLSGILHCGYQLFLMMSYRIGDLTQVYPIARGVAPMLVAVASFVLLGVILNAGQLAAIALISLGVAIFGVLRIVQQGVDIKPIILALITGCFIAAYSMNDGMGARVSGSALSFYAYSAIVNFLIMMMFLMIWRRNVLREAISHQKIMGAIGGGASFIAYALVLWAFMQAPIAMVTALREVSILFAMLIGTIFLKEKVTLGKLVATGVIVLGIILMKVT